MRIYHLPALSYDLAFSENRLQSSEILASTVGDWTQGFEFFDQSLSVH